MSLESKKSRVALFFAIGLGLSLLMAALKAAIALATHTYLYSVPWVGGFLKSIELTEISNLLVFAILGSGMGAATVLLPRRWDHRAKLAILLVVSPFVFCASYMMQQSLWIQQVAAASNLSYREARSLTNDYLTREVGSGGFFGFYPFSTQLAELPVQAESLRAEGLLNPNELLSEELSSYNDPRADFVAYVFERVGWLIRFMYMTLAALTAIIYYFKGHAWAESRPQTNSAVRLKTNLNQSPPATSTSSQLKRTPRASRPNPPKPPFNPASRKAKSRGLQAHRSPESSSDKPDTATSSQPAIPPVQPEDA